MTTAELAQKARELTNHLFRFPICTQVGTQLASCLRREETRPLTSKEMSHGWSRRPFNAYDTDTLCGPCRCYWFAEMTAQTLHDQEVAENYIVARERGA